jgi:hypothetical protein
MPRFHFHLRAAGTIHRDTDGMDLPDLEAVREHATAVAQELMRHSTRMTRHWSICVEDEHDERALDLFFADVDPSLAAYSPQTRMLVIETSRRLGALTDALCEIRATQLETRILIARSRGKPYLAYAKPM